MCAAPLEIPGIRKKPTPIIPGEKLICPSCKRVVIPKKKKNDIYACPSCKWKGKNWKDSLNSNGNSTDNHK